MSFIPQTKLSGTSAEYKKTCSCYLTYSVLPPLLCFAGTKSSNAVDFKGKNVPDDREKEDEENEALDFFKEENTPDLISQLLSVENVKKGEKKEEGDEEEEEILDPLGIIRYG